MATITEVCAGAGMSRTVRLAAIPKGGKALSIKQVAQKAIEELCCLADKYKGWDDPLSRHMFLWIADTLNVKANTALISDEELLGYISDRVDLLFEKVLVSHLDLSTPLENPLIVTYLVADGGSEAVGKYKEAWEEWLWRDYTSAYRDVHPEAPLQSPYISDPSKREFVETVESHLYARELTNWGQGIKSWVESHLKSPVGASLETEALFSKRATSTVLTHSKASGINRKLYQMVPSPADKIEVAKAKLDNYSIFSRGARAHDREIKLQYENYKLKGLFARLDTQIRKETKEQVEAAKQKTKELFEEFHRQQAFISGLHEGTSKIHLDTIGMFEKMLADVERQLKDSQDLVVRLTAQMESLTREIKHLESRIQGLECTYM